MAGETRGALAEAIAKVALDEALSLMKKKVRVFWEELPEGAAVRPDLTVGPDKDHPECLILVNASDNVSNSHMKYWRNISEIFDAKSRLATRPAIIGLFFKSEIKPELIKLTAALCDATHHVDLDPVHGLGIANWLEENHSKIPSEKAKKEEYVLAAISTRSSRYDEHFAKAIRHLSATLSKKLLERKTDLQPLWDLVAADRAIRRSKPVRAARVTLLRRGLARWIVLEESIREKLFHAHLSRKAFPKSEVPNYAAPLGMLEIHINGAYIPSASLNGSNMSATTSSDLRMVADFYREAASGDTKIACDALRASIENTPLEMLRDADLLRKMPLQVASWHKYVTQNWSSLITPSGCYQALSLCREDSSLGGKVTTTYESRVWLYDHLIAMIRAHAGRNNDFGYGALVSYFKANQNDPTLRTLFNEIISSLSASKAKSAKRWVTETLPKAAEPGRRGFQDWLAGEKEISPVVPAAFAFSLASILARIPDPKKQKFEDLVSAHAYGLWNKLLTHQDFEPLVGLIEASCGSKVSRVFVPTVMADLADRAVQKVGYLTAQVFNGGLIYWKSATDAGKDHKCKELCGRARALRYTKTVDGFMVRSDAKRLILVIDGTFNDSDLKVLTESGWDEIYYPDEMDKLLAAIE
jgi:hypothetical protein